MAQGEKVLNPQQQEFLHSKMEKLEDEILTGQISYWTTLPSVPGFVMYSGKEIKHDTHKEYKYGGYIKKTYQLLKSLPKKTVYIKIYVKSK